MGRYPCGLLWAGISRPPRSGARRTRSERPIATSGPGPAPDAAAPTSAPTLPPDERAGDSGNGTAPPPTARPCAPPDIAATLLAKTMFRKRLTRSAGPCGVPRRCRAAVSGAWACGRGLAADAFAPRTDWSGPPPDAARGCAAPAERGAGSRETPTAACTVAPTARASGRESSIARGTTSCFVEVAAVERADGVALGGDTPVSATAPALVCVRAPVPPAVMAAVLAAADAATASESVADGAGAAVTGGATTAERSPARAAGASARTATAVVHTTCRRRRGDPCPIGRLLSMLLLFRAYTYHFQQDIKPRLSPSRYHFVEARRHHVVLPAAEGCAHPWVPATRRRS